jgi:hypothetical protein
MLQASVSGYCQHLREQAAGRGGEAGADVRARLRPDQAGRAADSIDSIDPKRILRKFILRPLKVVA